MSDLNFSTPFQPFRTTHYKFKNLVGRQFSRLTVISIWAQNKTKMSLWLCLCDCGKWNVTASNNLLNGHSRSCGCLSIDVTRSRSITHGESYSSGITPEYRAYIGAKSRCTNPNNVSYSRYGGRGIKFLFTSFDEFMNEVGRRPTDDHSLDRFPEQDGNYEIGNIRWATPTEQSRNTRRNHKITINGEAKCIAEWCKEFGINGSTVHQRIRKGWSEIEALTVPLIH